jgi:pyruvate/2-oxoglutarate dehydrogenase complex dihydrolipoamide dehydrogenase (E3) component
MPAMQLARNASQLARSVTIYTNNQSELAVQLSTSFGDDPQFKVDDRGIVKLSKGENAADVVVHFADGSTQVEAFLAHSPKTHAKGPFVEQLGLETTPQGDIKVNPPFGQTSSRGVFAAGDNMTPFKIVPQAMSNAAMVAAGVSMQLQCELHGHKSMV